MNLSNIVIPVILAAVLTVVTFVQLRKKDEYTTGKIILTCVLTFILCAAAGLGVELLMSNINLFGN